MNIIPTGALFCSDPNSTLLNLATNKRKMMQTIRFSMNTRKNGNMLKSNKCFLKLISILDSWHPSHLVGIFSRTLIHFKRREERKSVLCDTWNHLKCTQCLCASVSYCKRLACCYGKEEEGERTERVSAYFMVFACTHGNDLAYHFGKALHPPTNSILHNKFLTSFHIYWHYWDVMWFSREVPIYRSTPNMCALRFAVFHCALGVSSLNSFSCEEWIEYENQIRCMYSAY